MLTQSGDFRPGPGQVGLDFLTPGARLAEFNGMTAKFELGHNMPGEDAERLLLVRREFAGVVRWLTKGPRRAPGEDRAIEILRERYARGEIDKNEFEARKRDLA